MTIISGVFLVFLLLVLRVCQAQQCSSETPCPPGNCCSNWGWCGNTQEFCSNSNCKSQCPRDYMGVNYGTLGNDLPDPSRVVQLVKSIPFGVNHVKIYASPHNILSAFVNSGLRLTIAVPNGQVNAFATWSTAFDWVKQTVVPFASTIDMVVVGNELDNEGGSTYLNLMAAMWNVRNSLLQNGLWYIKVTTSVTTGVLKVSYPPSAGAFKTDGYGAIIPQLLDFLKQANSPFMVDVYPYFSWRYNQKDISLDYALFRKGDVQVWDGGFGYRNLFDAMVDAIIAAVERSGHGNMEVVIGESGWPSGGGPGATVENARQFNSGLVAKVKNIWGTPRRAGRAVTIYIFALFNENQKTGEETEKHFGLYYPNGSPVYSLNAAHIDMNASSVDPILLLPSDGLSTSL